MRRGGRRRRRHRHRRAVGLPAVGFVGWEGTESQSCYILRPYTRPGGYSGNRIGASEEVELWRGGDPGVNSGDSEGLRMRGLAAGLSFHFFGVRGELKIGWCCCFCAAPLPLFFPRF